MKIHQCGNLQSIAANRARGKKMNRHNSIIDIVGNVVITNKFHCKIIIPNPAAITTISGGEERAAPLPSSSAIHNLFSSLLSVW
jgi:hypothetical protein